MTDGTQTQLLKQLAVTEELLARAASLESGRDCSAEIIAMPDLGLPHNVRRIHGGFYTGAYYGWETDVPIVPIDATVNLCGVSLFRVAVDVDDEAAFMTMVERARKVVEERTPYVWNFTNGNHFIILAEAREGGSLPPGQYLVLHASPAEFKSQFNGLYPTGDNWYAGQERVIQGHAGGRYLRYLTGEAATRFHNVARMLESYQRERQRICAELLVGPSNILDEVLNISHYGMPDQNSVAIGCQWLSIDAPDYLLLTRPRQPLYHVSAVSGGQNEVNTLNGKRLLTPHGLGVRALRELNLQFLPENLGIAGLCLPLGASLSEEDFIRIRDLDAETGIDQFLNECPGNVMSTLHQVYAYYRKGTR